MAMSNRGIIGLKVGVHLACLAPLLLLVWDTLHDLRHPELPALLGPDPTATLAHATGYAALRVLIVSLAITPVRRFSKSLAWLIRFRRTLGLYAFVYTTLHLAVYLKLYANLDVATIVDDLTKRRYIVVGFAAWLLLVPLALTSTRGAIRRLGKRWQMLHRAVYLVAALGVVHYWWIVKKGVLTPLPLTLLLALLLLARPAWSWLEGRRARRRAAPSVA